MRIALFAAAMVAASALMTGPAAAAFHLSFSAHDLNGSWRFHAIDDDYIDGRTAPGLENGQLECRIELRHVNNRRAVATKSRCFDRSQGWHEANLFDSALVDFIVKSNGLVEIYLDDAGFLVGQFTRDRKVVKGKGKAAADEASAVVWTMTKA